MKITFGDLNSNLLPKGTLTRIYYPILLFLLLFGKKGKIIPPKKKSKKIKKIKKNQRDLNSNLLPNTTFPIVENYAQKKNSKKIKKIKKNQKKSKKSKKIKKNQRDLNSNLLPNTTFPIVENYAQKKNSKKIKKIKKNQKKSKKSKKIKKILNSNLNPTIFLSKKQTYLKPVIDQCMGVYSSFSAFEDNNKF